jgi:hypothetical protein
MPQNDRKNLAPCIVNKGTIYRKKDMFHALEAFERVKYKYVVDDKEIAAGEGLIAKVFASKTSATLVLHGCLFINVVSFDYLNFHTAENQDTIIELEADNRKLYLEASQKDKLTGESNPEIVTTVDSFDEEETFALLEDSDFDEED